MLKPLFLETLSTTSGGCDVGGIIGLILSLLVLCGALICMVKLLHSLVMGQAKKWIMKAGANWLVVFLEHELMVFHGVLMVFNDGYNWLVVKNGT